MIRYIKGGVGIGVKNKKGRLFNRDQSSRRPSTSNATLPSRSFYSVKGPSVFQSLRHCVLTIHRGSLNTRPLHRLCILQGPKLVLVVCSHVHLRVSNNGSYVGSLDRLYNNICSPYVKQQEE